MGPSGHFYSFLFICGPGVVVVKIWDKLYLGKVPLIKETLPDFHEWCRVTRHPRLFRRLTSCQRDPRFWGVTYIFDNSIITKIHITLVLQYIMI